LTLNSNSNSNTNENSNSSAVLRFGGIIQKTASTLDLPWNATIEKRSKLLYLFKLIL
jgi:hypothetical protein